MCGLKGTTTAIQQIQEYLALFHKGLFMLERFAEYGQQKI
jgi:hypothetical protein